MLLFFFRLCRTVSWSRFHDLIDKIRITEQFWKVKKVFRIAQIPKSFVCIKFVRNIREFGSKWHADKLLLLKPLRQPNWQYYRQIVSVLFNGPVETMWAVAPSNVAVILSLEPKIVIMSSPLLINTRIQQRRWFLVFKKLNVMKMKNKPSHTGSNPGSTEVDGVYQGS